MTKKFENDTKIFYEKLSEKLIVSKLEKKDGCFTFTVDLKGNELEPFDVIVSPRLIKFGYYFCGHFELRYKGSLNNIQGAAEFIVDYLSFGKLKY